MQEALVRAWQQLPSLRDPDRFDAWLYRLVVNACATRAGSCGVGRTRFGRSISSARSTTTPDRSPIGTSLSGHSAD